MRKIKSSFTIPVLLWCLFLGACLKDKYADEGRAGFEINKNSKIVEIGGPVSGSYAASLDFSTRDTSINLVTVRVAAEQPVTEDVQVTVRLDPALVTAYNAKNNTKYVAPASNIYKIDNLVVTIPNGSQEGYLKFTAKPSDIAAGEYALGVSLVSVSNPGYILSGNFKSQVVIIGVKNRYDGLYKVTGSLIDLVVPTITGLYPLNWELVTNGANSVTVVDKDYTGTPTHIISSGGAASQYGSFGLIVNFDPATNKITNIVNYYGQPAPNGRSAALDPTGVNAYDPATRTIKIKYNLLQPGTTVRTRFDETWNYIGPR